MNLNSKIFNKLYERQLKENVSFDSFLIPNKSPGIQVATTNAPAYNGQYTSNGDLFFCTSQDFKIHVYDPDTLTTKDKGIEMKKKKMIQAASGRWTITDATLLEDPQFRLLAYSSITPFVHLVDLDHEEHHHRMSFFQDRNQFGIWSIKFSKDGHELLAGTSDQNIMIYDLLKRKVTLSVQAHDDDVNSVCFQDESRNILISGSDDGLIKVWDRRSLNESDPHPGGLFVGHTEGITHVTASLNDPYIISNGKDQRLKVWDLRKLLSQSQLMPNPHAFLDWDYRWMTYPQQLERSPIQDNSVMTFKGHSILKTLIRCYFSPSHSNLIYTGSSDDAVYIYNLQTASLKYKLKAQNNDDEDLSELSENEFYFPYHGIIRDVSWHPYLPFMISSSWRGSLHLFTNKIVEF